MSYRPREWGLWTDDCQWRGSTSSKCHGPKKIIWALWWKNIPWHWSLSLGAPPSSHTHSLLLILMLRAKSIMPQYSVRQLASASFFVLDAARPYRPVEVSRGVVRVWLAVWLAVVRAEASSLLALRPSHAIEDASAKSSAKIGKVRITSCVRSRKVRMALWLTEGSSTRNLAYVSLYNVDLGLMKIWSQIKSSKWLVSQYISYYSSSIIGQLIVSGYLWKDSFILFNGSLNSHLCPVGYSNSAW